MARTDRFGTDRFEIAALRLVDATANAGAHTAAIRVFLTAYEQSDDDSASEEVTPALCLSGLARCRTIAEARPRFARSRSLRSQTSALLRTLHAASHPLDDIPLLHWPDLSAPKWATTAPLANCIVITEIDFQAWNEAVRQRLALVLTLARQQLGLVASMNAARLIKSHLAELRQPC